MITKIHCLVGNVIMLAWVAAMSAAAQEGGTQLPPPGSSPTQAPAQSVSSTPTINPSSTASAVTDRKAMASSKPLSTFLTQSYLTGDWGGFRDKLKSEGVTFTPTLTAEVFGNPSGGMRQGAISDGFFNLPLDLDFDPLTGGAVKDLTFHVNAFYIYGASLSQSFVGDFSNTSNAAGYNSVRLDELWIQKGLFAEKLTLKVGNMDISNEFFRSNSASLFINNTFGAFTLIGNNLPDLPVYPLANPGIRIQLLPDPKYYVMAGVYGMDNNSFQNTNNKNGIRFSLNANSGMLIMSEAGFLLNHGSSDKGLQGNYAVGSFVDTGNFITFSSQTDFANGTGPLRSAGADYGIYGVVDQQIYVDGPEILTVFTRAGGAPSNTNFVDYYVDGGFNLTGSIPTRDNDVAGLSVARSRVSPEYSTSQVAQGNPPSTAETVVEATYKMQISPWWSVQPDFQYIVTPSGIEGSHNAIVIGLRTNIAF